VAPVGGKVRRMKMPLSKLIDMPPLWLLAFAVLVWGLGAAVPVATGLPGLRAVGTLLVTAGCALILWAAWEFRRQRTTIVPHQPPSALVETGPFARSRNPIYLADAVILTGLCLRWDILPGLLLVPVFMRVIQTRFISAEEGRLRAAFPAEFARYAAKTRRWL
jgi:protein-S-isoprenylcysteine O-methyltransferase Ste14